MRSTPSYAVERNASRATKRNETKRKKRPSFFGRYLSNHDSESQEGVTNFCFFCISVLLQVDASRARVRRGASVDGRRGARFLVLLTRTRSRRIVSFRSSRLSDLFTPSRNPLTHVRSLARNPSHPHRSSDHRDRARTPVDRRRAR